MPELPEVETVRRGLTRELVGRRFESVRVGRERVARRTSRDLIELGLEHATVLSIDRRGKYLLLRLDNDCTAMIHLRMSGQVLIQQAADAERAHSHVVAELDDGRRFAFVDPRTFGEVVVVRNSDLHSVCPELLRLGPDPIVDGLDAMDLWATFSRRRRRLKSMLLDQSVVAGLGNIYADEVCHRARLRPDRASDSLNARHVIRLVDSIDEVLVAAIERGGSTLGDGQYVAIDGMSGDFQNEHRVYGRTKQRCDSCRRGIIRRIIIDQRGTHFCPVCQR